MVSASRCTNDHSWRSATPWPSTASPSAVPALPAARCMNSEAAPGIEMLRQPREVQVGAVVEQRAAYGDADGAAEVAHQVEQARGQPQSLRREAAQCQRHRRCHRELLREAAQRLWQQQFAPAPVVG